MTARRLVQSNILLLVLLFGHVADHVRQGRPVGEDVTVIGFAGQAVLVIGLILAVRRDRLAPDAAIALGFGTAAGFVLVHFLPAWWELSDSYPDAGVDAFTWLQASTCVLAALWLGAVGLRARGRYPAVPRRDSSVGRAHD